MNEDFREVGSLVPSIYTKEQIAEFTGVELKSKNFRRDVGKRLANWGYSFRTVNRNEYEITRCPQTAEEHLAEILRRTYGINVQIDIVDIGCYIALAYWDKLFQIAPWKTKARIYAESFGKTVDERALSRWGHTLADCGLLGLGRDDTIIFRTIEDNGIKRQSLVETEEDWAEYDAFREERYNLVRKLESQQLPFKEAFPSAVLELWQQRKEAYYKAQSIIEAGITLDIEVFSYADVIARKQWKKAHPHADDTVSEGLA